MLDSAMPYLSRKATNACATGPSTGGGALTFQTRKFRGGGRLHGWGRSDGILVRYILLHKVVQFSEKLIEKATNLLLPGLFPCDHVGVVGTVTVMRRATQQLPCGTRTQVTSCASISDSIARPG